MPETEVIEQNPVAEPEVSLADYRQQRSEAPATVPEKAPVKSAVGTEPAKAENSEVEEADTDAKPKGGFQRRIDKLTKEKSELERTVGDLSSRLEALEKPKAQVVAEAKAEGDPEPKEENFKDYKDFIREMARWVTRQETKNAQEQTLKAQQEQTKKQTETQKKEKLDIFVSELGKVRDADPAVESLIGEMQIPDYIHTRLVNMGKVGAELTAALAKNKEVQQRIIEFNNKAIQDAGGNLAAADFSEAYWEFGAFVRSLSAKSSPEPQKRPVSQAPAPITPVRGGDAPSDADADKMSLSEYRKARTSGRLR